MILSRCIKSTSGSNIEDPHLSFLPDPSISHFYPKKSKYFSYLSSLFWLNSGLLPDPSYSSLISAEIVPSFMSRESRVTSETEINWKCSKKYFSVKILREHRIFSGKLVKTAVFGVVQKKWFWNCLLIWYKSSN